MRCVHVPLRANSSNSYCNGVLRLQSSNDDFSLVLRQIMCQSINDQVFVLVAYDFMHHYDNVSANGQPQVLTLIETSGYVPISLIQMSQSNGHSKQLVCCCYYNVRFFIVNHMHVLACNLAAACDILHSIYYTL